MRLIVFVFIFNFCFSAISFADEKSRQVTSLGSIQEFSTKFSLDGRIADNAIIRAQAVLKNLKGIYYNPSISADGYFEDNKTEPTNPFQPARTKEAYWNAEIEQKTPIGVTLKAGASNTWTEFFQSSPPNPLLPYPASYYQPHAFVGVEIELIQNFLGYITRREINSASLGVEIAKLKAQSINRQLYAAASSLYTQIIVNKVKREALTEMAYYLHQLRKQVGVHEGRAIAERSDVLRIDALFKSTQADVYGVRNNIKVLEYQLLELLGLSSKSVINPKDTIVTLTHSLDLCENKILKDSFSEKKSSEILASEMDAKQRELQGNIYRRYSAPKVTLEGQAKMTGTDSNFGNSYTELSNFDRPVYRAGLNFSWPLSPLRFKASRLAAEAEYRDAKDIHEKIMNQKKFLWESSKESIKLLREKHAQFLNAVKQKENQSEQLSDQFQQGRLSLYILTEEEINRLEMKMRSLDAFQERIQSSLAFIQNFDQFYCPLAPERGNS